MDQLSKSLRERLGVLEARVTDEHARHRQRFHDRIEFMERLDRHGHGVLVPVIRRRSPNGRLSSNA